MTELFYTNKPIIGLDISKTGVRVVSADRSKMLISGYGSIDLDPSKIMDDIRQSQDYLLEKLQTLFQKNVTGRLEGTRAVLGIPAARTFTRTFTLPVEKEGMIKQAVSLETEQYIPMPLENLYVDYQVIKRGKTDLTVLTCAVPRQFVDGILEIMERAGIDVAMIEPSINAVSRLLEATGEGGGLPTIIVDIGPVGTDVAIYDSAIRVTGSLTIGSNTLTLDIAKHMGVSLETSHQLKVLSGLNAGPRQAKISAALRPSLMKIVNETNKVMRFYTDRFPEEGKLEQVLIVGSGSGVPGLGDFFTNELIMPARIASPWQELKFSNIEAPAKQLKPRLMAAAGLSLVQPQEIWS